MKLQEIRRRFRLQLFALQSLDPANSEDLLVSSIRFELMTYRLGGGRSILLSYKDGVVASTTIHHPAENAYPRWELNPHHRI